MLHNHVTNEFKNSAVARDQRDVRTTWAEAKWMTLGSLVLFGFLVAGIIKQLA